jgi:hypothetical protein
MRVLVKHVARLEKEPPEEIRKLDAHLQKGEKSSEEAFNSQELGLQIVKEVASYYSTPIELLEENPEPQDWKPLINYKSPREITAATGYFDPSEKGADFTRTWLFWLDTASQIISNILITWTHFFTFAKAK